MLLKIYATMFRFSPVLITIIYENYNKGSFLLIDKQRHIDNLCLPSRIRLHSSTFVSIYKWNDGPIAVPPLFRYIYSLTKHAAVPVSASIARASRRVKVFGFALTPETHVTTKYFLKSERALQ